MVSWNQPTQEQIDFVVEHLEGNLKSQFFAKLENPLWFAPLKEQGLLWYETYPNPNDPEVDSYSWSSMAYLIKITQEIPNDVMNHLQPLISKINDGTIETFWFVQLIVLSVAPKMPDDLFLNIMSAFANYLNHVKMIDWFDEKELLPILQRLKVLSPEITDKIAQSLLSLHLEEWGSFGSIEAQSKYGNNDDYRYNEVLKIIKDIYQDNPLELLSILIDIFSTDIYVGITSEQRDKWDNVGYAHRASIEESSQNMNTYDSEYNAINTIRDISLQIINRGDAEQINKVFSLLESGDTPILSRIAIYLLSVMENPDKARLSKYITDYKFFDDSTYHHEYYHLIKNKFNESSNADKEKIFGYIESGSTNDYYNTDDASRTATEKQNVWKLHKLTPIRDLLNDIQIEKYKSILFDANGKKLEYSEHPDFSGWVSGMRTITHQSPIEPETIQAMSIDEIIVKMNNWQPEKDVWEEKPDREGFARVITEDIKTNPQKYIIALDKFKAVNEPTYIRSVIRGIIESGEKSDADWEKIINFSEWVAAQNGEFADRDGWHDGDKDWYWAKQEVVSLLNSAFHEKTNLSTATDELLGKVFSILNYFIEAPDRNLDGYKIEDKKPNNTSSFDTYLHRAINSLHGQAVEALLTYNLWLKNNNKSTDVVIPVLDKLLADKRYLESYAIIAHALPWTDFAIHDWVVANLDKLFPTTPEGKEVFNATWPSFILYTHPYNTIFNIMQDKFRYVLKNNLWPDDKRKDDEKHIAQHLALYYALGAYELDSDILNLIFDNPDNLQEQISFVNHIGFSLWDKDKKGNEIPPDILKRYRDFWEWFIEHIKDKKSDYIKVLTEFERWYQCGRFTENDWCLKQLHALINDKSLNLTMRRFMLEENLEKDLPNNPRLVFDIVSRLSMTGNRFDSFSRIGVVEKTLEYIKNHEFPTDATLKSNKDSFINAYLEKCETWEIEQITERFSKYLEPAK